MSTKTKHNVVAPDALFDRVAAILEEARGNVVRAINSNMVFAYWLIGREIVQELQGGEERAKYGRKVIAGLSAKLTERFGKGYSTTVLWSFRRFYLAYADRDKILSPAGRESGDREKLFPTGRELVPFLIPYPAGRELLRGFSPHLSRSHYRALMRVENVAARDFYEREAIECGWSKTQLERQIHSFHFIDLVFYNYVLKCFLLIDLKMGKLSHADIGQMDGYVRLYENSASTVKKKAGVSIKKRVSKPQGGRHAE